MSGIRSALTNDAQCPWRERRRPFEARARTMTRVGVRLDATTAGAVALFVSLVVLLVWNKSHVNSIASHVQSKSWFYGGLLLWSVWSVAQKARHQWGTVVVDCVHKVDDVMMRVSSSQTMTRIKSSVSSMCLMDFGREAATCRGNVTGSYQESRSHKISLPTPFLPLETIAALSLTDMKYLVQYAMEVNKMDFNGKVFASTRSGRLHEAIQAMESVVAASRGSLSTMSFTTVGGDNTPGDMDALMFIAFVRVFAEWRSLRLVPRGYQRYAVGMGLAKRDLIQNTLKVETAVHLWMGANVWDSSKISSRSGQQLSTPTLRQLLIWERDTNLHQRLPKLMEKSGASGLLWILRQLRYQTAIFDNLTKVPLIYPTGKDAVAAAYNATYHKYHGFLVKQIFRRSFDAAPGADDILSHMNQGQQSLERTESIDSDCGTESMTSDDDSEPTPDVQNVPSVVHQHLSFPSASLEEHSSVTCVRNPLDQFTDHIVSEWMKLERFMSQCNGSHVEPRKSRNVLVGGSSSVVNMANLSTAAHPQRSLSAAAAEEEIPSFISAMHPVLRGLDNMIHQLNMNDPSKC